MIKVEIADTVEKQSMGLMFRKSMPDDSGMFFKFNNPKILSFWMANTYLPLDIAFIDDNMKIIKISYMAPLSTRSIHSDKPCRYALEVPTGTFSKYNINVGSKLKLKDNIIFIEK